VSAPEPEPYPDAPFERSRWILARRGARERLDPSRAVGQLVERERTEAGAIRDVATVFLANRECPWRCLMCDLWTRTLVRSVAPGAIVAQIAAALSSLPAVSRVKLYNAGSFFDPRAIPREDHGPIARLLGGFERIVVECHPALVGSDCFRFAERLDGRLEVAMGLETAHPDVLERLNKGMTLDSFRRAAEDLGRRGIALRVFALVGLPFLSAEESLEWSRRSVGFAFDCGATAVTLIPTRAGNGALDALERRGEFSPPTLELLERAAAESLSAHGRRGRVFADTWDFDHLDGGCASCRPARRARLEALNLEQWVPPPAACPSCEGAA
jgi:radical SAM enzyme (TIGR01210 family)